MAKALMGHVGLSPDARLIAEVQRLRATVRQLEADNEQLRARAARLQHELDISQELRLHDEMLSLEHVEPALT